MTSEKLYFSDHHNTARNAVIYVPAEGYMPDVAALELALDMTLDGRELVEIALDPDTAKRVETRVSA